VINQGLDQKCNVCFYVSLDLASIYFLLARSGRKTDGYIINIRMFIMFFMFFFCLCKAYTNKIQHKCVVLHKLYTPYAYL
jgi:hypothetical protein